MFDENMLSGCVAGRTCSVEHEIDESDGSRIEIRMENNEDSESVGID